MNIRPPTAEMEPIERMTLGDRAYRQIADLLIAGRLAPGERMSLRSTAEALGVSMMPIREAVTRLVADNALEVAPNRAVRVPIMSATRFLDLTAARIVVEGHAAARAATLRDEGDLARIRTLDEAFRKETQKRKPDLAAAVAHNQALHFAVYEAARSPQLAEMIRSLWLKAGPVINLDLRANPDRLKHTRAVIFHADLVDALIQSDSARARAAVEQDIQGAADFIVSQGHLPE
ncbi:GntR family transcriptional regulator [Rhizobiales bacterium TNE-4]|nr:GntR family transcriptional regulator [Rhizobiales bacterium TNE-4]MBV1827695.1 GntR family transcriptional regulator [Rhizobiales bacterium TNE-4]